MELGRLPLLKQNHKSSKASLAATWAAELQFLWTQLNLKAAKETAKQRMLLMEVLINRPITEEIQGAKGVKNRGFSDTFKHNLMPILLSS